MAQVAWKEVTTRHDFDEDIDRVRGSWSLCLGERCDDIRRFMTL